MVLPRDGNRMARLGARAPRPRTHTNTRARAHTHTHHRRGVSKTCMLISHQAYNTHTRSCSTCCPAARWPAAACACGRLRLCWCACALFHCPILKRKDAAGLDRLQLRARFVCVCACVCARDIYIYIYKYGQDIYIYIIVYTAGQHPAGQQLRRQGRRLRPRHRGAR